MSFWVKSCNISPQLPQTSQPKAEVDIRNVEVEDFKTDNANSFSDHNSVSAKIKLSCDSQ